MTVTETNPEVVVLLYYKYVPIENAEEFAKQHLDYCKSIGLLGRIIVAKEGINGTVSGTKELTDSYIEYMHSDPKFADMEFKVELYLKHPFKKMHVRPKSEIVNLGRPDIDPNVVTGIYLEPEEFKNMIETDPDIVILDTRNNFESAIGKFKGAITPDIDHFRDFPDYVKTLDVPKDKKILAYCTGGIRCEKATGVLLEAGYKHVYQLHGGIIRYGQLTGGPHWEGKCYVFDGRISVVVNQFEDTVISQCSHCKTASDRYINCTNPMCNKQIIVCENCETEIFHACSKECAEHPKARWREQEKFQTV